MDKSIIALLTAFLYFNTAVFTINEGHLGLIYRGNALLNYTKINL